jgi:hypothetical protein
LHRSCFRTIGRRRPAVIKPARSRCPLRPTARKVGRFSRSSRLPGGRACADPGLPVAAIVISKPGDRPWPAIVIVRSASDR